MRIPWPVISLTEKIIQTDIAQKFLKIFRDTQDIHRVLIVIPLTLFLSHSWYMKSTSHVSLVVSRLNNDEIFWLILAGMGVVFGLCWAVFSSSFNVALYIRQFLAIGWTGAFHRWYYGLDVPGTIYWIIIDIVAFIFSVPFVFWGLRPDQLLSQIKDEYKERKNTIPAVVEVPASNISQKSESNAA